MAVAGMKCSISQWMMHTLLHKKWTVKQGNPHLVDCCAWDHYASRAASSENCELNGRANRCHGESVRLLTER